MLLKKLNPISFGVSYAELTQILHLKIFPNFQNPIKLSKLNLSEIPRTKSISNLKFSKIPQIHIHQIGQTVNILLKKWKNIN
jgi:hypothetical protein